MVRNGMNGNEDDFTQWLSHVWLIKDDPNVLAGFILAPVYSTTAKCPNVTVKPIAKGAIYLESGLFSSQTP